MKKYFLLLVTTLLFFGVSQNVYSQNIAINLSGTPSPNATAILDMSDASNNKLGVLLPNVSISAFNTMAPFTSTPTTGMIVWNTNAAMVGGFGVGFYYWSGTQWNYIQNSGTASAGWNTTGNAGTNPAVNYAGTSDPQPFLIKTQGAERMRFLSTGHAGIGTATPASMVDVNGNMTIGTYAGTNAAPANGIIISGQVGIGTNTPNASAALDVTSTSSGFLIPRMTAVQMAAIAAPATGLLVFNTTSNCMEFYTSTAWQNVVCPCTGPPAQPGIITGSATPCASSAGNVYTIAVVATAISYNWTVPAGATITAGAGTTSITVTFGTTSGSITVSATNSCGTSAATSLAVTLNTIPASPATPTGPTSPAISLPSTYTIATVPGATTYTWSVSTTNGTVTAGQGTTSANITFSSTPATMNICVTAGNACGNSAPSCLTVTSTSCLHGSVSFTYTGSITTWLVPACVSQITITAKGAQGGASSYNAGGLGAIMTGTFTGLAGQTLQILVGGMGGTGSNQGGGGGGTFVCTSTNAPVCIAGGGGGANYVDTWGNTIYMPASTTTTGNYGVYGNGSTTGGAGGTAGAGGGCAPQFTYDQGMGGAGLLTNGCNDQTPSTNTPTTPMAFVNGGAGGNSCYTAVGGNGGFGGGGAGDWCAWTGGGGGGGYSGGGGGTYYGCGGGGGSYNGGTAQTNTVTQSGNGSVTITY